MLFRNFKSKTIIIVAIINHFIIIFKRDWIPLKRFLLQFNLKNLFIIQLIQYLLFILLLKAN